MPNYISETLQLARTSSYPLRTSKQQSIVTQETRYYGDIPLNFAIPENTPATNPL